MSQNHNFVTYLETLIDDRAALAALRRGLGQPPGTVPDMHRYVIQRLPDYARSGSWTEQVYYLMAALYALHPESAAEGNLGDHFARTLDPNPEYNTAVERRFTALLVAHPADFHFFLRHAISFLRSKEVAVNWHQLMWDVLKWDDPDKATQIQKRWAAQFWRRRQLQTDEKSTKA